MLKMDESYADVTSATATRQCGRLDGKQASWPVPAAATSIPNAERTSCIPGDPTVYRPAV